ncbi:MAG: ATP synthase F1 subunit gamma [Firmicutes bacterium]|nr:ATP synthase F1 subunit gamma [Bacillota bacterium]
MQSTRDIKRRINSVKSTQQITKAMEMVAAAKLRKAQARVTSARPYTAKLTEVINRIVERGADSSHTLLEPKEGRTAYIVIAGNRGLAGAYNVTLLRFARDQIAADPGPVAVVGRKARDFMRKLDMEIIAEYLNLADEPSYQQAVTIMDPLLSYYEEGVFGRLNIIYTRFQSALQQRPTMVPLLPVDVSKTEERTAQALYLYEPSPETVLASLLPRYVRSLVFQGLLEARASEEGSRMTAMKSATDNANEMIDSLTLSFNRVRQAAITQELLEVVNGAQALEG